MLILWLMLKMIKCCKCLFLLVGTARFELATPCPPVMGAVRRMAMNTSILTASHYGVVHFGDLECEAVVLKGGERGYVRRQLAKLLGFHEGHKGGRFARFLTDFAPNSLSELEKTREPILLPSGRQTQFFPAGIIADLASAVVNAALTGTLHKAQVLFDGDKFPTIIGLSQIAEVTESFIEVGETLLCNSDDDMTTATFNRVQVPIGAKIYIKMEA